MKYFQAIPKDSPIDAENGIIRKCSLIKIGAADGHFDKEGRQETVDEKTLTQVFEYCQQAESIKVKLDHGSGVLSTVGYVKNFSIENGKVVGDFHIYETADEKNRILEVAAKNPHHMGMSLEFEGADEVKGDKAFSRCSRVLTVALVSDPAANTSLFSAIKTETTTNTKMEDETKTEEVSLEDRMNELSKKFEDFTAKFAKKFEDEEKETELEVPATDAKDDPAPLNPPTEEDETKKIELAAKRGAEEAIKQFTAKFGTTALGKAGSPAAPQKEKHFEEHVTDIALKEFSGDTTKARAAVLSNKAKYGDAWKAYEASRLVKHS
jgi:hypothetical protein